MTSVVALVTDLMDRSRIASSLTAPVEFIADVNGLATRDPSIVLADLRRAGDPVDLRRAAPHARIIAFGSHVDDAALDAAREAGIDDVMPRSTFFRTLGQLID